MILLAAVNISVCQPLDWASDAIWYQIFPERFHNGDPHNDPTIESLDGTWPYDKQEQWSVTPWTSDWYKLQPWEEANGQGFYYNAQLRRYGGDIQGIIDKLDYLEELGVNALYLNPVFESPSSHKYGTAMYRHIDNNFGSDPEGDERIWAEEDPTDPSTWQWTAADQLFLQLVEEVHNRDMHIIIDGVFNHVGIPFWAFQHAREHGEKSPYADWFYIKSFDDPATPEDEFSYKGWFNVPDLPELKEEDSNLLPPIREHLHKIVKRWMDPNGDGDPSDGIDGWRLDVAEMVGQDFWREFSSWVQEINPNAYTTAEIWWEDYFNNVQYDASPWVGNDGFTAVMNYRFGDAMYKFFNDEEWQITATDLDRLLADIREDYGLDVSYGLQNIMCSHDCERLASAVVNPDRWIDHGGNLQYNPEFDVRRPNDAERQKQKVILAFQFTYLGAPYIYYGDEVGMWGADDPDCRKPMVWSEFEYETETTHPLGHPRQADRVEVDGELFDYYRSLIKLRKEYPALRYGSYRTVLVDDQRNLFAFERTYSDEVIRMLFNGSQKTHSIPDSIVNMDSNEWEILLAFNTNDNLDTINSKSAKIFMLRSRSQ